MAKSLLTPKQELFCLEYIKDLNATKAAIRAGYSKKGAHVQGCRLLTNVKINVRIQENKANRMDRVKVDADWVLERLIREADADISDLYDEEGRLKSVHDWPLEWRQGLVAGMDITSIGDDENAIAYLTKVKLSDRLKRIELVGKHVDVKAFDNSIELSIKPKVIIKDMAGGKGLTPGGDND